MNPVIIAIVGGGAFAPRLCEALAGAVDLPEVALRLWARRADRLKILADHTARRLSASRPGWSVQAAPSLETALEGAAITVLLVRVGGLEARAWDEAFPQRFGLVGDEGLGPGGIANAWRTLPVLAHLGQTIRRVAPAARVLNLMAPLGLTTRLLLQEGLDAIGVCELPLVTLETWLDRERRPEGELTWRYGGLNHLGWFWRVRSGEQDLLQLVAAAPASSGQAPIDRATLDHYQAAPLRYFYEVFDRQAGRRLGVGRPPNRARQLIALSESMVRRISAHPGCEIPEGHARATPWLDRAVAPMASALLGGPSHAGFANLRNGERIPELPADLVVELAATITSSGACPVAPGSLPPNVAEFLGHAGQAEMLAFLAASQQDPALLAEAIRALPLPIPDDAVLELTTLARGEEHR